MRVSAALRLSSVAISAALRDCHRDQYDRAPTQTAASSCAVSGRPATPAVATDGRLVKAKVPSKRCNACKSLFSCLLIAAIVQHRAMGREVGVKPRDPSAKCPSNGAFFEGVDKAIRH